MIINSDKDKALRTKTAKCIVFITLSMRFVTTNVPLLLKKTTLIDYKDQYIRDMTIHDSLFDLHTSQ